MINNIKRWGLLFVLVSIMVLQGCSTPSKVPSTPESQQPAQTETSRPKIPANPTQAQPTPAESAQAPVNTPVVETKPVSATIEQGYGYDGPQWGKFTTDIKSKTGEILTSFYAPESPSDKNVIFVSTSGTTTGEWPDLKSTNRIYSYNIQTGELTKLYEELENRLLRTMGIEGAKLIVMLDAVDNSPGPCSSPWSNRNKFGYLDTANPAQGLSSYTVPDYQVQKGEEEQKKCQIENGL